MKFVVIKGTYHKVQTSKVKEFKPQRIKIISVISEIRSSNQKVNCELREWHELFSNKFSVISEIRSWYDFAIMIRKIRNMYSNFFYILVNERVGERNKNVLFWGLCKYFILN